MKTEITHRKGQYRAKVNSLGSGGRFFIEVYHKNIKIDETEATESLTVWSVQNFLSKAIKQHKIQTNVKRKQ